MNVSCVYSSSDKALISHLLGDEVPLNELPSDSIMQNPWNEELVKINEELSNVAFDLICSLPEQNYDARDHKPEVLLGKQNRSCNQKGKQAIMSFLYSLK
eukprot:TRINITY_DN13991_c0_g1_i13.p2 TRINITY_DN13991_c0_g1~~TRINITY_DN13991_c0_g1_i13.p2  ORF type:complete len:100 (-),score=7.18 TRINITY_DN13991_c0_g1_i13:516-815(-)